eukprot:5328716-Alexandrium_andersonii.AAC.1
MASRQGAPPRGPESVLATEQDEGEADSPRARPVCRGDTGGQLRAGRPNGQGADTSSTTSARRAPALSRAAAQSARDAKPRMLGRIAGR